MYRSCTAHVLPMYCSPFVYIDAHILATPAIADIDGDGTEELVVAVSYFYDRQYYEKEVRGRGAVQREQDSIAWACQRCLPSCLPACSRPVLGVSAQPPPLLPSPAAVTHAHRPPMH